MIIVPSFIQVCYNLCQCGKNRNASRHPNTPRSLSSAFPSHNLKLIENLFLPLQRSGMFVLLLLVIAIFLDRRSNLLGHIIVIDIVASVRISSVEVRAVELVFLFVVSRCFAGFALFDLTVEADLLAALVAVPEDEHEDCGEGELALAIRANPVEINLLKTAKLMTTFVVLTKNGKRTCKKLTMFRRMLATTPLELVRLFRPGMRLFFFC